MIPPLHGFTVLDDHMVIIDLYNTGLLSRGRRDVEIYQRIFEMNRDSAVPVEPLLDEYQARYVAALAG
jgi:hypothetical protein